MDCLMLAPLAMHCPQSTQFGTDNLFTVQLLPNHLMKHDTQLILPSQLKLRIVLNLHNAVLSNVILLEWSDI